MQNNENAQNEYAEALEALARFVSGESEDLQKDASLIGAGILKDVERREKETNAKMPNVKGILAAKKFEELVKRKFPDAIHFEKMYSEVTEDVGFDLIIPRLAFFPLFNCDDAGNFECLKEIIQEADDLDIGVETENPEFEGNIYFDITFKVWIRT